MQMLMTDHLLLTDVVGISDPGTASGTCYICGRWTACGHREQPSSNFTAWADVYGGDVLCQHCRPMLKDRRFRACSWLATRDGVRFRTADDRDWLWPALNDPPAPPFAFYVTRGGQKQGWIRLLHYVSFSRTQYWVGTDWTARPVLIDASWRTEASPLLEALRERGVTKRSLESGVYAMAMWDRAWTEGWADLLEQARRYAGDPRWEVLVYACP